MAAPAPISVLAGRPTISWAIETARGYAGMSRDQLAGHLESATGENWTYNRVRNLESGKQRASFDIVSAVARATGVPLRWFEAVNPQNWKYVKRAFAAAA